MPADQPGQPLRQHRAGLESDALAGELKPADWIPLTLVAPVMLVLAYNAVRIIQLGFNQLRDALFARVGQHAVRQLGYRTFRHLHELSLRFHLERRTGGLSRVIERGTKGIETIVRFTILNTVPTIIETMEITTFHANPPARNGVQAISASVRSRSGMPAGT